VAICAICSDLARRHTFLRNRHVRVIDSQHVFRYLSLETLVFRDSKLQVRQGGMDSEFDVLGRTMEAEMKELLTKTLLSNKVEEFFWVCCIHMLRALCEICIRKRL
jgi:predicted DNA-binding transcriptional regulator